MNWRRNSYAVESQTLDIAAEEPAPTEPEPPPAPPPRPAARVLLLDDLDDFREVMREFLVSSGYAVTSVANGAEGLRQIVKDPFDLIICDMMMPQLGGEMFYWAVTRVRPAAAQRFIFFTGHRMDLKLRSFFERVNAIVLFKPFPLDALSTAIRKVHARLA